MSSIKLLKVPVVYTGQMLCCLPETENWQSSTCFVWDDELISYSQLQCSFHCHKMFDYRNKSIG